MKKCSGQIIAMLAMLIFLTSTVTGLTACSGQGKEPAGNLSTGPAEGQASSQNAGNTEEKPLYVIPVFGNANLIKRSDETPVYQKIKEKFNIVFEMIPGVGDYKEKLNLMLAAGDYPELLRLEDQDTTDKYIKAGALLPLDPYLDKCPNFVELYKESIPYWRLAAGDGKLYNWNILMPQDLNNFPENNDIAIRSDILEEAGWPNIVSSDDYVSLLSEAIKKHPLTDGKKTLGIVAPFGESWGMAGIGPIMYEKGRYTQVANGAVAWSQPDKKFVDMVANEYTKEGFQFFNKLYRNGVLDRESFTDKMDQVMEKLNSGRALGCWYIRWVASGANSELETAGKANLQYITLPVQSPKQIANNEKRMIMTAVNRPFDTVVITKNAKYPERIMELVDWASSDEGQILLQSGIEGVHYTRNADGKRVPTEEYKKGVTSDKDYLQKQGLGALVGMIGNAACSSTVDGQPYDLGMIPEVKDELLPQRVKDAYKAMGWRNSMQWWQDNAVGVNVGIASGISINPATELGALEAKIADLRLKYSSKIMLAKSDEEFENLYNTLLKEHEKLQPQKVVDEYNRLYTEGIVKLEQYMK